MAAELVSIIIPCYNAEKFLTDTLDSAHRQTWPAFEIILVDDGSTDGSWEIAQAYKSSGLRTIRQKNSGPGSARNAGLGIARGTYIQFLDADDLLSPDKIARQMALFSKIGPGFVVSSAWGRFVRSPDETALRREAVWSDMDPISWLVCCWERGGMMPIHGWLIPKGIIVTAGPWREDLRTGDDGEYMTRVILASEGVRFCPDAVCYYRSEIQNSVSGRSDRPARLSVFRSIKMASECLLAKEDSARVRHACATVFQDFVHGTYPESMDLVRMAEKEVQICGGSDLKPGGGSEFAIASRVFGWKFARRLQRLGHRLLGRPGVQ